jgi:hypothetical protein
MYNIVCSRIALFDYPAFLVFLAIVARAVGAVIDDSYQQPDELQYEEFSCHALKKGWVE